VVFTFSVLIKVTFAVFPLAIVGLVLLEKAFSIKLGTAPVFAGRWVKFLIPPMVMMGFAIAWILWTKSYNNHYHSTLFLANAQPYWSSTAQQIQNSKNAVVDYWYGHIYFFTAWHLFYFILIVGLINLGKWNATGRWLCLLLIAGSYAYGLFFFKQFAEHDYYLLPFFIPLAFAIIYSLGSVSNRFAAFKTSILPALAILVVTALSFSYAAQKLATRTYGLSYYGVSADMLAISGKLETYGVPKTASILSIPDETPNGSLYYLQRKGLTYNPANGGTENYINAALKNGIQYLVISGTANYKYAVGKGYNSILVGEYKSIMMFKITGVNAAR
jgi:hypothetical protein